MTRAELKRNAREKLGGKLFGPNWVNAVLVMAIFYILTTAINGITGLGTLIMQRLFRRFRRKLYPVPVKIPFHRLMVHSADHSRYYENVFLFYGIFYKGRSSVL